MKYCGFCKTHVSVKKHFSWFWFIVLTLLTGVGGLVYLLFYALKKPKCPICGGHNFISEIQRNV